MPVIPRQIKPPARTAITSKVPEAIASLLKCYAEFLDSSQEHVVTEVLRLTFRKDREFHTWLTTTHPELRLAAVGASATPDDQPKALAEPAANGQSEVASSCRSTRSKATGDHETREARTEARPEARPEADPTPSIPTRLPQ
jgi:hypothetical protein